MESNSTSSATLGSKNNSYTVPSGVNSSNETSESLMLAYAEGDTKAFEKLYSLHKAPLFRTILRQGFDTARAEELFQEIWLKVINARKEYQPNAKFQTWLYTIARNRVIDEYRRLGRTIEPESLDDTLEQESIEDIKQATADVTLQNERNKTDMLKAIEKLNFEQRQAFLLKFEAGMTHEDIAIVTSISSEAAKSRVRYAVNTLKRLLGGQSELN